MKIIIGIISAVLAYWLAPISESLWVFLIAAAIIYIILTKIAAAVARHKNGIIGAGIVAAAIAICFGPKNAIGAIVTLALLGCGWGALFLFLDIATGNGSRARPRRRGGIGDDEWFEMKKDDERRQAAIEEQERRQAEKDYWYSLKQEELHRNVTGDRGMEEYYKDKRRTAYDDWSK